MNSSILLTWLLIYLDSVDNDGLTILNTSLYAYGTCIIKGGNEVS